MQYASRKVMERDWRIVVPDEEASGASVLLIRGGCGLQNGLQNKIKMHIRMDETMNFICVAL